MSFKQVKALRQTGRLEEALSMAMDEYGSDPSDIWNKRSLFWVLYEYLKQASEKGDVPGVFENLDRINKIEIINLPDEGMARTNLFRCMKLLFRSLTDFRNDPSEIEQLANRLCNYSWNIVMPKPSPEYSAFLDAFLQISEKWSGFMEFVEKWNLKNLNEEDYQMRTIFGTKKTYMSLAETAFIAYSKSLLGNNDQQRMRLFQPELDRLADNPQMPFLGYFNAKMLLAMNSDNADVLTEILPFAKRKINEYWVWQFLSEVFEDDEEKHLACLLRATHCRTKEDFLPKIRIKLINYYYDRNDLPRMKHHTEKYIQCRLENGYRISPQIQRIVNSVDLDAIQADDSDPIDYLKITNTIIGVSASTKYGEEKRVTGIIQSNKAKTALFVKHNKKEFAYIPKKLSKGLSEGDRVQATIMESMDPKRNKKSWICTKIKKQE